MIIDWYLQIHVGSNQEGVESDREVYNHTSQGDDVDLVEQWALDIIKDIDRKLKNNLGICVALLIGKIADVSLRRKHGDYVFIGRVKFLLDRHALQAATASHFWRSYGTSDGTNED